MAIVSFARKQFPEFGLRLIVFLLFFGGAFFVFNSPGFGGEIKEPNVAGQFYPADKDELSLKVENLLNAANPQLAASGSTTLATSEIFCLICPYAGYDFSGPPAALGYKLIKGRPYKTVIILGPSHQYYFKGVSVYPAGKFQTPLGDLEVDSDFTQKIISPVVNAIEPPSQNISPSTSLRTDGERSRTISFIPQAFEKEHSIEVQLPFLQKTLDDFKIVPILIGDADFQDLSYLADKLNKAIADRSDVLLIASTDLCHSYDYQETEKTDKLTLSYLENISAPDIYAKLKDGSIQMCGGLPVVSAILIAQSLGYNQIKFLGHTNSAEVMALATLKAKPLPSRLTGKKMKGMWTVGYLSALINGSTSLTIKTGETAMLNDTQKARLLEIARKTIQEYVTNGKKLDFSENDPQLNAINGAFVTIHKPEGGGLASNSQSHKRGELRGCIGNIIGQKPLFETIRDMAIESATGDPRFEPVTKDELKDIEIEISVLSPLKKIEDMAEFQIGVHGVLVKKGWSQGVFLPQVAEETGWNKEEFLSNLCVHKAGLPADAWKDAKTEKYIFSALVFSEKKQ